MAKAKTTATKRATTVATKKAAPPKGTKAATRNAKTPADDALPPDAAGSEAAFLRFRDEARAYAGTVRQLNTSPKLVAYNANLGVAAMEPERARLAKELPLYDFAEAQTLPALAQAVVFAAMQVDRHAPSEKTLSAMLKEATGLRANLLAGATALVAAGLVPAREVKLIRAGRGAGDMADDCVALAALFRKYGAAIRGKTAVTAAEVRRAAELGTELQGLLRVPKAKTPKGAKAPTVADEAAALRDRLWTLLALRHDRLRRAAAWLFGFERLDEKVPPLGAHRATPAKKKPAAPATP